MLRGIAPDAVFVHHEPYALATFQLYAANAISVRAPIGCFTWQNLHKRYPPPFRQLEQWVYRTSAFAFAGSESATDVLRAKGYQGPVGRLPGTVDPERFRPQRTRARWCAQYGVDPDALLVGYAGRLIEAKGLFTLLEALTLMDEPVPEMVFIGEGTAKAELTARAQTLGLTDRIRWIPYVPHPEMPEALSAMDLMVLPSETQASWKEQFGRIIIESLACGTPIVGSDSGEIPHLLRHLGQDTIVPEGEAPALAAELELHAEGARTLYLGRADLVGVGDRPAQRAHRLDPVDGFARIEQPVDGRRAHGVGLYGPSPLGGRPQDLARVGADGSVG